MTARKNPPLLRVSALTKTAYIVTRYTKQGDLIKANEKYDCTDDLIAVIGQLSISEAAFDEVAAALGFTRSNQITGVDGDA